MFFVKLSIALSEIASGWEIYAIEMSYVLYDSWKYIFFLFWKIVIEMIYKNGHERDKKVKGKCL